MLNLFISFLSIPLLHTCFLYDIYVVFSYLYLCFTSFFCCCFVIYFYLLFVRICNLYMCYIGVVRLDEEQALIENIESSNTNAKANRRFTHQRAHTVDDFMTGKPIFRLCFVQCILLPKKREKIHLHFSPLLSSHFQTFLFCFVEFSSYIHTFVRIFCFV